MAKICQTPRCHLNRRYRHRVMLCRPSQMRHRRLMFGRWGQMCRNQRQCWTQLNQSRHPRPRIIHLSRRHQVHPWAHRQGRHCLAPVPRQLWVWRLRVWRLRQTLPRRQRRRAPYHQLQEHRPRQIRHHIGQQRFIMYCWRC